MKGNGKKGQMRRKTRKDPAEEHCDVLYTPSRVGHLLWAVFIVAPFVDVRNCVTGETSFCASHRAIVSHVTYL